MNQIPDCFRLENCIGDDDYYMMLMDKVDFRYFMCLQINLSDPLNKVVLLNAAQEKFGFTKALIEEWSLNLLSFRTSIRSNCIIDDFGLNLLVSLANSGRLCLNSDSTVEVVGDTFKEELQKQIRYSEERDVLKQLLGVATTISD